MGGEMWRTNEDLNVNYSSKDSDSSSNTEDTGGSRIVTNNMAGTSVYQQPPVYTGLHMTNVINQYGSIRSRVDPGFMTSGQSGYEQPQLAGNLGDGRFGVPPAYRDEESLLDRVSSFNTGAMSNIDEPSGQIATDYLGQQLGQGNINPSFMGGTREANQCYDHQQIDQGMVNPDFTGCHGDHIGVNILSLEHMDTAEIRSENTGCRQLSPKYMGGDDTCINPCQSYVSNKVDCSQMATLKDNTLSHTLQTDPGQHLTTDPLNVLPNMDRDINVINLGMSHGGRQCTAPATDYQKPGKTNENWSLGYNSDTGSQSMGSSSSVNLSSQPDIKPDIAAELAMYSMMGDDQDDDERIQRRRERNRVAAQKCRQKKRDAAKGLMQQYQDLESSNTNLRYEIRRFQRQKNDLQRVLSDHLQNCQQKKANKESVKQKNLAGHKLTTAAATGSTANTTCITTTAGNNQQILPSLAPSTGLSQITNTDNSQFTGRLNAMPSQSTSGVIMGGDITATAVSNEEEINTINSVINQYGMDLPQSIQTPTTSTLIIPPPHLMPSYTPENSSDTTDFIQRLTGTTGSSQDSTGIAHAPLFGINPRQQNQRDNTDNFDLSSFSRGPT